ncbi:hypothetical protein B0H11DRAFT_121778 [Mycena galericulata]|nr:hypothetical protein B0H11DRAFT_121681 [Mycena galericulata]KAJ7461375.1 hypothetical protein B0H11DRAFT_121778 [Mycena galericulata]
MSPNYTVFNPFAPTSIDCLIPRLASLSLKKSSREEFEDGTDIDDRPSKRIKVAPDSTPMRTPHSSLVACSAHRRGVKRRPAVTTFPPIAVPTVPQSQPAIPVVDTSARLDAILCDPLVNEVEVERGWLERWNTYCEKHSGVSQHAPAPVVVTIVQTDAIICKPLVHETAVERSSRDYWNARCQKLTTGVSDHGVSFITDALQAMCISDDKNGMDTSPDHAEEMVTDDGRSTNPDSAGLLFDLSNVRAGAIRSEERAQRCGTGSKTGGNGEKKRKTSSGRGRENSPYPTSSAPKAKTTRRRGLALVS